MDGLDHAAKLENMYNRDNMTAVNYQFAGVQLYGGPRASNLLNISETHSFHLEYSSLACTVEIVDDVFAAIDHIHHHGRQIQVPLQNLCFDSLYLKNLFLSCFCSAHTECIVAEDSEIAEAFLSQVDR